MDYQLLKKCRVAMLSTLRLRDAMVFEAALMSQR